MTWKLLVIMVALVVSGCLDGGGSKMGGIDVVAIDCPMVDGKISPSSENVSQGPDHEMICISGIPHNISRTLAPERIQTFPLAAVAATEQGIVWAAVDAHAMQLLFSGAVNASHDLQWSSVMLADEEREVDSIHLAVFEGQVHAVIASHVERENGITGPRELMHVWLEGTDMETEELGGPPLGMIRQLAGLESGPEGVAAVATDLAITDFTAATSTARTMIWQTGRDAFEAPIIREGYWTLNLAGGTNDLRICARTGDEIVHARSPSWEFQHAMQMSSIALDCRVASAPNAATLGFALPLAGSGGGSSGSDDAIPYHLLLEDSPEEIIVFDRRPGWLVEVLSRGHDLYLLDDSPDSKNDIELSIIRNSTLVNLWGGSGDQMRMVGGLPGPAFFGMNIDDGNNDSGWSLIVLRPIGDA